MEGNLIYPNPGNGEYNIRLNNISTNTYLKVYDLFGNIVEVIHLNTSNNKMDLRKHSSGVYFVCIYEGEALMYSVKLVKL